MSDRNTLVNVIVAEARVGTRRAGSTSVHEAKTGTKKVKVAAEVTVEVRVLIEVEAGLKAAVKAVVEVEVFAEK